MIRFFTHNVMKEGTESYEKASSFIALPGSFIVYLETLYNRLHRSTFDLKGYSGSGLVPVGFLGR